MELRTVLSQSFVYFAITYKTRNYAEAAREIPISYQGLRKALAKLEEGVGERLFTVDSENAQRLIPSKAANRLYDMYSKWTDDFLEMQALLDSGTGQGIRKALRICAPVGFTGTQGFETLQEFSVMNPTIKLDIAEYPDYEVDELILSGTYPLGITVSPFVEEFDTRIVGKLDSIAWINRQHPLSHKKSIHLFDLDAQDIAIPNKMYKAHKFFLDRFAQEGIAPHSIRSFPDVFSVYSFAHANKGIGICLKSVPETIATDNSVICLPVENGYVREIGISCKRGHILTKVERKLFDALLQAHKG